jgi:hypothetical protein
MTAANPLTDEELNALAGKAPGDLEDVEDGRELVPFIHRMVDEIRALRDELVEGPTADRTDVVIAVVSALNRRGGGPITRDDVYAALEHVAAFHGKPWDPADVDRLLEQMNADDEIEILGHPEQITVGRKPRWAAMLRAGAVTDAQLDTVTRVQWGWCRAGDPCAGCGNPLCVRRGTGVR